MNNERLSFYTLAVRVCVCLALSMLATSPAFAGTFTIPAGNGTLTYTATYTSQTQECVIDGHISYETVFQSTYSNFSFTIAGTTTALSGGDNTHTAICNYEQASFPPITFYVSDLQIVFTPSGTTGGSAAVTTLTASTFDPLYKVVSILYSPPGNGSSQGYGTSTTHGTSTSVSSSFTNAETITFTTGFVSNLLSLQESASTGFSTTNGQSSEFDETWTDATSLASDDNSSSTYNPTKSDSINHNLDSFVVWLNPQVTVYSTGTTPYSYVTNSQSTTGLSAVVADISPPIPAVTMEANSSGATTVPVSYLIPTAIATDNGNVYMPGLGAICKNNSLYSQQLANPTEQICTLANQCGCVPSDFAAILETDPLLDYNSTTYTASPYTGTTDPLSLDKSGVTVCAQNPIPAGSDCRYWIVPVTSGSTTTQFAPLDGTGSGGFTQSDSTTTTMTTFGSTAYSTGLSYQVGPMLAQLTVMDTWTWTDTESSGETNGQSTSMFVNLSTSTAACDEEVSIYEDLVYHTYVFQVPTGNHGCN